MILWGSAFFSNIRSYSGAFEGFIYVEQLSSETKRVMTLIISGAGLCLFPFLAVRSLRSVSAEVGQGKMKGTLNKISTKLPTREVKVKAHAYTMAAVVMLFFSLFAVLGVKIGIKERDTGALLLGLGTLVLHGYLVGCAIYYFRKEKAKSVAWSETEADIS